LQAKKETHGSERPSAQPRGGFRRYALSAAMLTLVIFEALDVLATLGAAGIILRAVLNRRC
jgi:hypothetical protein